MKFETTYKWTFDDLDLVGFLRDSFEISDKVTWDENCIKVGEYSIRKDEDGFGVYKGDTLRCDAYRDFKMVVYFLFSTIMGDRVLAKIDEFVPENL